MDGVRVLEVAIYAFAPAAGAVLADWGADVVKVEHPEAGDPLRGLVAYGVKPGDGGVTYLWEVLNRGKRSIGIDIASDDGRELLLSLCEGADVFLTNFLAPARQRLGIDADAVTARNPRIIYARGTGHGPRGPDADKGGYDGVSFWARSGVSIAAMPPDALYPVALPGPFPVFPEGAKYNFAASAMGGLNGRTFKIPNYSQNSWAHPVVVGGRLYQREQDIVWCYDVSAR